MYKTTPSHENCFILSRKVGESPKPDHWTTSNPEFENIGFDWKFENITDSRELKVGEGRGETYLTQVAWTLEPSQ